MGEGLKPKNREDKTRLRGSDEDRISKLPDSVLHHILSFVSTKDAIRTSILSTRWRSLWVYVPCLDLDTDQFSDENDCMNFVDRFLDLRGEACLHKFKLKYDLSAHDGSRFKPWIETAVKCKVEHLDVQNYFADDDGVELPQSLCICNTLAVLKLDQVVLDIPDFVSLASLKIMHLEEVIYADDSALKRLICGCPVLEDLSIIRRFQDNIKVLCVCSPMLKRLSMEVERFGDGKEYGVVIDTPHLEYLSLRDHQSESFVINNLGLSVEADINVIFNVDYGDELEADDSSKRNSICKLLAGISTVRKLIVSWDTLEILYHYWKLKTLPQFHNLIHLEATFCKLGWEMLPAFLECCPNLKFFILGSVLAPESKTLGQSSYTPQCLLSSLESIELRRPVVGEPAEMDLISYFLENSAVLKQMKVYLSVYPRMKEESDTLKELLTIPRRSTACRVFVK